MKYCRVSTITEPAASTALTTLANLKLELNITDTNNDMYWTRQIETASSIITKHCNRIFGVTTYFDDFQSRMIPRGGIVFWNNGFVMPLANIPVVTINSIIEDGVTLEVADYFLTAETGFLYRLDSEGRRVRWQFQSLEVDYDAGWALPGDSNDASDPTLPLDIERATIETVLSSRQAVRLTFTDRDPFLRAETVQGVGTLQYSQTAIGAGTSGSPGMMSDSVRQILERYRAKVFA